MKEFLVIDDMKVRLYIVFVIFLFVACRPYKESGTSVIISSKGYSKYNLETSNIKSLNDFPKRILKSDLFKYYCLTTDYSCFLSKKGDVSFFINGSYNIANKKGYILFSDFASDSIVTSRCILFDITNNKLNSSTFNNIPADVITWQQVQPYLIITNMALFGAWTIMTKKELQKMCSCNNK